MRRLKKSVQKQYYFDNNGLLYVKRWFNVDSKNRRYAGEDGVLRENEWFSITGTRSDGSEYTNWYYADDNGIANREGWITVDGKKYHCTSSGSLSTEWYDDNTYYLGEDGAMRTGWQEIELKDDWIEDTDRVSDYADKYGRTAWFYFSEISGKRRKCTSGTYSEEKIGGIEYLLDTYGIMQKGWVRFKGGTPAVRGYRYAYPETAEGHVAGQIAKKAWVKVDVPEELNGSGIQYWYISAEAGNRYVHLQVSMSLKRLTARYITLDRKTATWLQSLANARL